MAEFIDVARVDQIPPGTGTTVTVAERELALFHVDGTVYATDDRCLHAGGSLGFGGQLESKFVTCRLHGWRYDVTTGAMPSAAGMRLGCYPVQVVDGQVRVAVPESRS